MVEAHPSLRNESRRGIGLGRNFKKRKAAYISAVVQEQRRQREANMRDEDALACAAMRVSKKDHNYAHALAKMHFEQTTADEAGTAVDSDVTTAVFNMIRDGGGRGGPREVAADEESKSSRNKDLQNYTEEDINWSETSKPVLFAKGFGQSKDQLKEVGLSVTGHALRRSRLPNPKDMGLSSADISSAECSSDELSSVESSGAESDVAGSDRD